MPEPLDMHDAFALTVTSWQETAGGYQAAHLARLRARWVHLRDEAHAADSALARLVQEYRTAPLATQAQGGALVHLDALVHIGQAAVVASLAWDAEAQAAWLLHASQGGPGANRTQ